MSHNDTREILMKYVCVTHMCNEASYCLCVYFKSIGNDYATVVVVWARAARRRCATAPPYSRRRASPPGDACAQPSFILVHNYILCVCVYIRYCYGCMANGSEAAAYCRPTIVAGGKPLQVSVILQKYLEVSKQVSRVYNVYLHTSRNVPIL
jgi:hypothetical protein